VSGGCKYRPLSVKRNIKLTLGRLADFRDNSAYRDVCFRSHPYELCNYLKFLNN